MHKGLNIGRLTLTRSLVRARGEDVCRESSSALSAGSTSQSVVTTAMSKNIEGMNVLHFFGRHISKRENWRKISTLPFGTHPFKNYLRVLEQNERKQCAQPNTGAGQKLTLMWWFQCNRVFAWASGLAVLQVWTPMPSPSTRCYQFGEFLFFQRNTEMWSMLTETYMLGHRKRLQWIASKNTICKR